ncbi:MAG: ATP-binding protein [Candidatus Aenigmatarchaeota archaeon]
MRLFGDKNIEEIDKSDIDILVKIGKEEDHFLDYKENFTLRNEKIDVEEFAKDISGFTIAGGYIIIGVKEVKHLPTEVCGIDTSFIEKETIDRWLDTSFGNKRPNVRIKPIRFDDDKKTIFVLEIKPDMNTPYMVTVNYNNRYYKRCEFQTVPMIDHEIKELIKTNASKQEKIKLIINKKFNDELDLFRKYTGNTIDSYLYFITHPLYLGKKLHIQQQQICSIFVGKNSQVRYNKLHVGSGGSELSNGIIIKTYFDVNIKKFTFIEFSNDGSVSLFMAMPESSHYIYSFSRIIIEFLSILDDFYNIIGYNGDVNLAFGLNINTNIGLIIDEWSTHPNFYYLQQCRKNPYEETILITQPIEMKKNAILLSNSFFDNLLSGEVTRKIAQEEIEKFKKPDK